MFCWRLVVNTQCFSSTSCSHVPLLSVNKDIVNLDVTTYNAGGYHGDLNETFLVGNVDDDGRRLVKTAFDCLAAAMALVKPGTLYRDLGTVIERTAKAQKCSVVRTYCGHGIGSLFHTIPNVPHYAKNKAKVRGLTRPRRSSYKKLYSSNRLISALL